MVELLLMTSIRVTALLEFFFLNGSVTSFVTIIIFLLTCPILPIPSPFHRHPSSVAPSLHPPFIWHPLYTIQDIWSMFKGNICSQIELPLFTQLTSPCLKMWLLRILTQPAENYVRPLILALGFRVRGDLRVYWQYGSIQEREHEEKALKQPIFAYENEKVRIS